MRITYYSRAER